MTAEDKQLAEGDWRQTIVARCPSCGHSLETNTTSAPSAARPSRRPRTAKSAMPSCSPTPSSATSAARPPPSSICACGKELAPEAKFCPDCGGPSANPPHPTLPEARLAGPSRLPQDRRHRRRYRGCRRPARLQVGFRGWRHCRRPTARPPGQRARRHCLRASREEPRLDAPANGTHAAVAASGTPAEMVAAALTAIGGIGAFVQQGDVVVIKPNLAWGREPEAGANTSPEVPQGRHLPGPAGRRQYRPRRGPHLRQQQGHLRDERRPGRL